MKTYDITLKQNGVVTTYRIERVADAKEAQKRLRAQLGVKRLSPGSATRLVPECGAFFGDAQGNMCRCTRGEHKGLDGHYGEVVVEA